MEQELANAAADTLAHEMLGKFEWLPFGHTVPIIALAIGISSLIYARFAGYRDNKRQIYLGTIVASIVGFFSMPMLIKLGEMLGFTKNKYGVIFLVTLLIIYVAYVAVNVYEITTVTAKEARPPD